MSTIGRTRPVVTFLVLAVAAGSFAMLQSLLNPVLSVIQRDLHTSQSAVTWILTAWLLSAAVATPLLGKVGDMIGKKRAFVIVLGAVALGSLIAALGPTLGWVIVGRVVQGLGGAIFPLAFGIIRDEFPRPRVPSAVGVMAAVIAVGGGLGTVLAGPVVSALSWRWLLWLPMMLTIVMAVVAQLLVPESPVRNRGRINWVAASLLAGWLVALLLPLSEASKWGWTSPGVLGLALVAIGLFVTWIRVETRTHNPVIDMRMMRVPAVWTTNLVALLFGASMFSVWAFVPQLAQTPTSTGYGLGATVTRSGLLLVPMLVTMAAGSSVSGWIAPRLSFRTQLIAGSGISAIATAGFAFLHSSAWLVATSAGVFGLGLGLAYAAIASLIVQGVPSSQTGVASGMNANIRSIGGAIGTAVTSSIVTATLQADGYPAERGYVVGFAVAAGLAVAATLVALGVPRGHVAHVEDAVATPQPELALARR